MKTPLYFLVPAEGDVVRIRYAGDPGVVIEHRVLSFTGAPLAYPVPPESVSIMNGVLR